ncbi:RHS repeat-associated core domain-containing protein [Fangia hongkongensis]|uniref:RHS repeat-associated core domain-containing protein n=1 Tax=Fangia hongkongensis TaxID=270495 RepID=UPI00036800FC|nr:RHS repeat-associated core domain-containing protein [Fangia hongkongensis]MBK2125543.1 RHS repeat-associated core domain-containing protein [Fangia hongkongensis]
MEFIYKPFIYGGGYYDRESGLNFQQARYYDANIQRFISQDSKNLINRYHYANANPVMNYDPSGHNAVSVIKKAIHSDTGILTLNLIGLTGSIALGAGGIFLIEDKVGVNFISLGINSAIGLQSGIVGMGKYIQFNNESSEKKSESKEIAFGSGIIATSSVLLSVFALAGKSAMSSKITLFTNEGEERSERSILDVGTSEFRGLGRGSASIGNVTEPVGEERVTDISALPFQEASLPHLNSPQIREVYFSGRQELKDGQIFSSRSSGPIVQSEANQKGCFGCIIL